MFDFEKEFGVIKTREDAEALTGPELVKVYNELRPDAKVKRFGDKKSAVRRVMEALKVATEGRRTVKKKKTGAQATGTGKTRGRKKTFNLKKRAIIKGHRPNTKRAILIDLLSTGATFAECQEATGWDYKTCFEGMKLLNTFVGYGMEEDENGVIKLVGSPNV